MNIEISNLDTNLIEADLQRLFTPYGEISNVLIMRDNRNNRPKGRAFIDMPVDKEAEKAIVNLNGVLLGRKNIIVTGIPREEEYRHRYFNF